MRITAQNINWRLAAGEFVLIVVGILLALAIDSWAEERKELAQADVYLKDMAAELRADMQHLEKSRERLETIKSSATRLLLILASGEIEADDPGGLLMVAVAGEGVVRESAIWHEIQMTGALRLIPDPSLRSSIVSHYLVVAGKYRVIEENFVPASRDLRALAWDVMPVDSFSRFFDTNNSGVAAQVVLEKLRARDDSTYLLKRLILTASVAGTNIEKALQSTTGLLGQLEQSI